MRLFGNHPGGEGIDRDSPSDKSRTIPKARGEWGESCRQLAQSTATRRPALGRASGSSRPHRAPLGAPPRPPRQSKRLQPHSLQSVRLPGHGRAVSPMPDRVGVLFFFFFKIDCRISLLTNLGGTSKLRPTPLRCWRCTGSFLNSHLFFWRGPSGSSGTLAPLEPFLTWCQGRSLGPPPYNMGVRNPDLSRRPKFRRILAVSGFKFFVSRSYRVLACSHSCRNGGKWPSKKQEWKIFRGDFLR